MRPHLPRRILLTSLIAILTLTIGGAASAYWRGSGSGAGSGTTGTTIAVTLTPGTAAARLYPGGAADVALTVDNPNLFPVRIGSFTLATGQGTGGFTVDAGHSGCAVTTLSFTMQTNGGAGWTVDPKVGTTNGTLAITLPGALTMGLNAESACQGATFTVYLAAET